MIFRKKKKDCVTPIKEEQDVVEEVVAPDRFKILIQEDDDGEGWYWHLHESQMALWSSGKGYGYFTVDSGFTDTEAEAVATAKASVQLYKDKLTRQEHRYEIKVEDE